MLLCISVRRRVKGGRGEGRGEGRKYSPSSKQFPEKWCKHSKETWHAKSSFSQQFFFLTVIREWIPLCFHSEKSALDKCTGIFQLFFQDFFSVVSYGQLLLRLTTFAVTKVFCAGLLNICIYRELPISTKTKNLGQTDLVLGNFGKDKCVTYAMASEKVFSDFDWLINACKSLRNRLFFFSFFLFDTFGNLCCFPDCPTTAAEFSEHSEASCTFQIISLLRSGWKKD